MAGSRASKVESRFFSPRNLIVALLAVTLRSFVACSHDVGPGDSCQGSILVQYNCPAGYICNDMHGWECTEVSPSDSTPRYPPPHQTADASIGEADASADDADADGRSEDGGSDAADGS